MNSLKKSKNEIISAYAGRKKKRVEEFLESGQLNKVDITHDHRKRPTSLNIFPELGMNSKEAAETHNMRE